jgi:hypothetical protein
VIIVSRIPAVLATALLLAAAPAAFAQATIAGVVRDASGGVLPGVAVEAVSPALIERSRTAVTDGTGQYRIVTLPPGTYAVTFSLPGFITVIRDNLAVSGAGVIVVSAEMIVGGLEETITVSGEAPLVDTQTTRRETVVDAETINVLPITRNYGGVLYATPGLVVQPGVNANDLMPSMALFSAHGGNSTEGRVFVDGVSVNGPFGSNSVTQFAFDVSNAEEMQVLVSGGLGESETGGPVANIVPRSGGNTFSGTAFYSGTSSRLQADNVDDRLQNLGIPMAPTVRTNWDSNVSLGGPLRRNRLWFFGSVRTVGIAQVVERGMAPNRHAGDETHWHYAPEPGVETRHVESKRDLSVRLTGQITRRDRVSFSHSHQHRCMGSSLFEQGGGCRQRGATWIGAPFGSQTVAPEAGPGYMNDPVTLTQASFNLPLSGRQLIDGAISRFSYGIIGSGHMPPDSTLGMIGVIERSGMYGTPGVSYRAPMGWGEYDAIPWNWRAAWSYVTGAHSVKVGYQGTQMKYDWVSYANPTLMRYIFNNGVPIGVTYTLSSQFEFANRAQAHAIYGQDQWTIGRVTVQGALRYDTARSWAPAEGNGTDEIGPFNTQPIRFPRTVSVRGYHDISPRMGMAYDLFGTGRTAVKVNAGRYLAAAVADGIYSSQSPALQFVRTISGANGRGWTDANGNYQVDCDLANPGAQNHTASGGDVCAGLTGANLNFGDVNPSLTRVDPDILGGWGVRPYNWQFGASVQHELISGVAVDVGYNRRWWGNFFVTHNELVSAADYDTWTLALPEHPLLPDVGSTGSFVAITPAAATRGSQTFQTKETNFAPARTSYWHGVDVNARVRFRGTTLQAGTSTGRGVRDTCELWRALPQLQGNNRSDACAVTERWLTSFRGLASYRVPKVDVLVSTTLRSTRTQASGTVASNGSSLSANYQLPNSVVAQPQHLGRLPAGALASGTTTVDLLPPGALYPLNRRNQVDVRFAKILRVSGSRIDLGVDVYNLVNANTTMSYLQTYLYQTNGATWLNPTAIMGPRLVRFNVTMAF